MKVRAVVAGLAIVLGCGSGSGGGGGPSDAAVACDRSCTDAIALRSLRDAMKVVYNHTLQGGPVGHQDQTTMCLLSGNAHVFGDATSNASQGTTTVNLTYVFTGCSYSETDTDPMQTLSMTLTGTVTEVGTIAVQPSSTTALRIQSDAMTFSGTVYTPPIDYSEASCVIVAGQDGNDLSGTICGRAAGLML